MLQTDYLIHMICGCSLQPRWAFFMCTCVYPGFPTRKPQMKSLCFSKNTYKPAQRALFLAQRHLGDNQAPFDPVKDKLSQTIDRCRN